MGFFNRSKRNNKQNAESIVTDKQPSQQSPFDITYTTTSDGKLQIDFYDSNSSFRKLYDTTRLIVRHPLNIANHQVYSCAVSWYGSNDALILNKKTGKLYCPRSVAYKEVLAEIDLELLQSDPNYCSVVMHELLDSHSVDSYLQTGLQENPNQPCGNYIGGVRLTENGYGTFFSPIIGRVSHNSELMVNKRQQRREKIEAKRQQAIQEKKAQLARLQTELDDMENNI